MSKRARSPVLGYNHNLRYGGRVFHVQTEDSGTAYARLYTHLFFEGTILSSKKQEYDPEASEDAVRGLMQKLHKTMIRELTRGEHNARINAFFAARGESALLPPPATAAPAEAPAPEPAPPPVAPAPPAQPAVVIVTPAGSGTPGPVVNPKVTPKPVVIVQPTALKRSPVSVSNPADGVVVRRNVVIDVGAGQPPVQAAAAAAVPVATAASAAPAARPKAGAHIAVRDGATFVAGNRARPAPGTEAQPHQPLASTREIRMPWETPAPRRVAQPVVQASAPVAEMPRVTTGKIRMPWDTPGVTAEPIVSDKSLDEVILEYLADDSE
jgi:hypothetical protein